MRRDEAVTRALEEWFAEGGGDVDAFLAKHDALASELRDHLAALELLDQSFERPIAVPHAPSQIGPYRIVREIGRGGMGTVYRAEGDYGGPVAVKVLHRHLLARPGFFKRFLREAELGRSVTHGNVVRTLDADALLVDDEEHHFLVMEYVEGRTLRELLDEVDRVPENLVRHIGHEVAQGLAAIHDAGVVHRDLKPENVLITEDHVVKVMDLGVARLQDDIARLSATGAFVGSIHYAAPEQFGGDGDGEADARADLHALGVLLYELAAGEHPFPGDDYRTVIRRIIDEPPRRLGDVNPQVSPFLEELVHRLLAKPRAERFASAGDVREILEAGEQSEWWRERARTLRVETKRPLRRIRVPRETALYGRDGEIGRLRTLYERARCGDGSVVLVEGEAGIGKSRLVDEFVARLVESGEEVNFVHASYPPGGAATAMGAFSAAYREFLGEEGLEDALAEHLTITPILVPAFAALLHGDAAPRDAEQLTKDSLQTCFVHLTRSLAKERATVVLIDDLHFAPLEGRALFASLALALPGHRILLIGTMRPGVPEDWTASVTRLEHATQFELARLGPKDVGQLLIDAFRSERLAEELGFKIVMKSDGNPFFVFEIIRGLREGQLITQRPDGTWVTTQIIQDVQVPSSVTDLVRARLSDLSDDERNLLDVAACWGFEFDPLLIAEVVGLERIPALRLLARIESKHRLVRSVGPRFAFDHHQVQETLYAGLPELLRQEYHGALAETLERRSGAAERAPENLDGALCVDLCRHYLSGMRGHDGLRYVSRACSHLAVGHQFAAAAELMEQVLDAPDVLTGIPRVRFLISHAGPEGALDALGRRARQEECAREALELAENAQDEGLILAAAGTLGNALAFMARHEDAEKALGRTLGLATALGDRVTCSKAHAGIAVSLFFQDRMREAALHLEHSLDLCRDAHDRRGEAIAVGNLGLIRSTEGRHAEAQEHLEAQLAYFREVKHRPMVASGLVNLANAHAAQGRFPFASADFKTALALCRESGLRYLEVMATSGLGMVATSVGDFADASTHLERAVTLSREIGDVRAEAIALVNLAETRLELGDCERARETFAASLSLCRRAHARLPEGYALLGLGKLADNEGDTAAALRLMDQSLTLRRGIRHHDCVAESLLSLGDLRRRIGDTAGSRTALEEALQLSRESGRQLPVALSLATLACLPGVAAGSALSAADELQSCEDSPHLRWLLYQATADQKQLTTAKRLLDGRLAKSPPEYHGSMCQNVRVNREIMEAWREEFGDDDEPRGTESVTQVGPKP